MKNFNASESNQEPVTSPPQPGGRQPRKNAMETLSAQRNSKHRE
jgi:hypothetical protein